MGFGTHLLAERLRRAAADLASEWARELWSQHRGEQSRGLVAVLGRNSLAMDKEGYLEARTERERLAPDSEGAPRARRLEGFCAHAMLQARSASAIDEVVSQELTASVVSEGEPVPYREVLRRIANESLRERRAVLARGYVGVAPRFDRALSSAAEARNELAVSLGSADAAVWLASAEGFDGVRLCAEAQSALDSSDDAYRDLCAFLRKRELGTPTGRSGPEWHDLARALRVESLDGHFGRGKAVDIARGVVADLGLAAGWDRIAWDRERRERRDEGAMVAALAPPFDVAVSVRLDGGAPESVLALRTAGQALAFTLADADRDADERRLLDPAWVAALGNVVARPLSDSLWHRRTLRSSSTAAIEAARACAVNELHALRLACAQTLLGAALGREGPSPRLREMHEDLFRKVTFSQWPGAWWIRDASRFAEATAAVRGAAAAAPIVVGLRDRFNEDWWRNPAAGRFLAAQASQAGSVDAARLAATMSTTPPTPAAVAAQLVAAAAV